MQAECSNLGIGFYFKRRCYDDEAETNTYFADGCGNESCEYPACTSDDAGSRLDCKLGFECIAESGVLFERGEIEKIPEEARELLRLYLGVLI